MKIYKNSNSKYDHIYIKYKKTEKGFEKCEIMVGVDHPCYQWIKNFIDMNYKNYKPSGDKTF